MREGLGWLGFVLGCWLWVGLALGWVSFGFGCVGFGPCLLWLGLALAFGLGCVGFGWVWVGLAL